MHNHALYDTERNLFLPALAGFFVAGIWLAPHVDAGVWPLLFIPVTALLYIPLRVFRLPLRLLCLPLALMLALLWTQHWLTPIPPAEGKYETITATVYGDSKINSTGNVSFKVTDVSLNGEPQNGKAYATSYMAGNDRPLQLTDGQRIRFSGKVYHLYPKDNEYDFDFRMWMLENRMHYGISSVQDVEVLSPEDHWADYSQRIISACYAKLSAVMGDSADLAVAMLLGDSDKLAEDDYKAFQRAGVAHIMAVSGLHVGILSMALLGFLEWLHMRKRRQIPVVALFLLLYCGVTGFAVSSIRASVMVLLWITARAFGRKANAITVISAAVLIVLILNPLQLFSAGFMLSFSAIVGIALLYPRFLRGFDRVWPPVRVKKKPWPRYRLHRFFAGAKQALSVALAAQTGVLLPIITYYHAVYPYSLSFNMFIVPIVSILVPLYALTTLTLWIPWIGNVLGLALGTASDYLSRFIFWLVRASDAFPLAEIRMAQPDVWVYFAVFISMVIISRFVRASLRRRLAAIAVTIVIAVSGSLLTRPPVLRYHQLSVGWADSALIIDGDTCIGIDTGDTGTAMINRLLAEGRDLDALILTHLHADHAGGVEPILDKGITIKHVYLPVDYLMHGYGAEILAVIEHLKDIGIPVTTLQAGDTLSFPETSIEVLWPQAGRTRMGIDPNDRSLAMLITLGNVRILSMADNGMLYEHYAAVPADILKVGHHGSSASTGTLFLSKVNPSVALISVRAASLPAESVLSRLEEQHVQVLCTEDDGEITIVPADNGFRAYRYLSEDEH